MLRNSVSILIVTYNAEKYIKKTLLSCLNQYYDNFEILILDNNSSDSTLKKIESLHDSRLRLFKSEKNIGPYAGLNFLLEKARGSYIAIQDHDDVWFPEKIQEQVKFLEDNSDFVACGTNTFYYYEDRGVFILNRKNVIADFVDHTSLLFRNNGFRYRNDCILADEHFEKKILSQAGKIACIQRDFTIHRIKKDATNLSRSRFKISPKNIKDFFDINKFNLSNFLYFFYLIFYRYVPKKIVWFVRRLITQRKREWLTFSDFIFKNPSIEQYL